MEKMEAVPAVAIEAVQTNQQNGGDAENEPLTPSGRSKRRASSSHTSSLLHMSALDSESLGEYRMLQHRWGVSLTSLSNITIGRQET